MNIATRFLAQYLLLLCAFQASASVPLGGNRKGVGGSYDLYGCMHNNDYYVVNFAAYQLDSNPGKNSKSLPTAECNDLPKTGKTQIALDLLDLDVRKKPVALKILRADGQVMTELPFAVVKQGVLSTTVDFKVAGPYEAVLMVDDSDLHTPPEITALHIPMTVGEFVNQPASGNSLLTILSGLIAMIATLAYLVPRWLKPQPDLPPNRP